MRVCSCDNAPYFIPAKPVGRTMMLDALKRLAPLDVTCCEARCGCRSRPVGRRLHLVRRFQCRGAFCRGRSRCSTSTSWLRAVWGCARRLVWKCVRRLATPGQCGCLHAHTGIRGAQRADGTTCACAVRTARSGAGCVEEREQAGGHSPPFGGLRPCNARTKGGIADNIPQCARQGLRHSSTQCTHVRPLLADDIR